MKVPDLVQVCDFQPIQKKGHMAESHYTLQKGSCKFTTKDCVYKQISFIM